MALFYMVDLSGDLDTIESVLQIDWRKVPFSKLCKRKNGNLIDVGLSLPDTVQKQLHELSIAFGSTVFCEKFQQRAHQFHRVAIKNIYSRIFEPTVQELYRIVDTLALQSMTLSEVNSNFRTLSSGDVFGKITEEFNIILGILSYKNCTKLEYRTENINSVVEKICCFFKLQNGKEKAAHLIDLGNSFNHSAVPRDFEAFATIESKASSFIPWYSIFN